MEWLQCARMLLRQRQLQRRGRCVIASTTPPTSNSEPSVPSNIGETFAQLDFCCDSVTLGEALSDALADAVGVTDSDVVAGGGVMPPICGAHSVRG